MQIAFPPGILISRIKPRLMGLRHDPFVNIDGEPFARPTLNGLWRVDVTMIASTERQVLALSSFLTAMRGQATTLLPMTTRWLPNGDNGRRLHGFAHAARAGRDVLHFAEAPFDGFTLRAAASHRDGYIDVNTPALSELVAGHFLTLGDRLHQVVNVTSIGEHARRYRVSVMPNLRAAYPADEIVIVDHLQLRCMLESADDIEAWNVPHAEIGATFVEAF